MTPKQREAWFMGYLQGCVIRHVDRDEMLRGYAEHMAWFDREYPESKEKRRRKTR